MFDRFRKDRARQLADKHSAPESISAPSTQKSDPSDDECFEVDDSADDATVLYRGSLVEMLQGESLEGQTDTGDNTDNPSNEVSIDGPDISENADAETSSEADDISVGVDEQEDEPEDQCPDDDSNEPWPEDIGPPKLAPRPAAPKMSARRPRHWLKSLEQAKRAEAGKRFSFTPEQRLLILDTWQRSGLPAGDFAELVSVSKHILYKWKKLFESQGPEGLVDQPKGKRRGASKLSEVTKRTILMLKAAHPDWGVERIGDMLVRGPGLLTWLLHTYFLFRCLWSEYFPTGGYVVSPL